VTIRVVIADDQALVRTGIGMILGATDDIEVVAEAANGLEAVALAAEVKPDVVLMDIQMPDLDGIEATRRIVKRTDPARTRVLVLTTFDLDEYVYDAIRAGASGFLLKDAPAQQLVAGVQMVATGDALLAPSITRRLIEEFTSARRVTVPPRFHELTAREVEVFHLVAIGMTNAEIAARLFLGETTVKTHVARILAKLNARDRVQLVVIAYESGLAAPNKRP
jgi:DNA-binding NarL/FixJ family response regulator